MPIKAKFVTSATTRATKEANARSGYSASGFFARASDIPAVVSKSLPDDQFCTIDVSGLLTPPLHETGEW